MLRLRCDTPRLVARRFRLKVLGKGDVKRETCLVRAKRPETGNAAMCGDVREARPFVAEGASADGTSAEGAYSIQPTTGTPGCERPATRAVSAGRNTPTPRPAHARLAQLPAAMVDRSRCAHLTTNEYSQWRNQYSQGCSLPPCARPVVDTLERHRSSLCHRHDYNTPILGDSATPTTAGDDSHPNPHRIVVVGIRAAAQAATAMGTHPRTRATRRPRRTSRCAGGRLDASAAAAALSASRCAAAACACKRAALPRP